MSAAKEYLEDEEPVLKTALNYTYLSHFVKTARLINKLRFGHKWDYAKYRQRGIQYRAMLVRDYPDGIPMASRPAPWRCVVYTSDIVLVLRCHKKTAQRKMKFMREEQGLGKGRYVTVKVFCYYEHLPEDYVQNFLNGVSFHDAHVRNVKLFGEEYAKQKNEDVERKLKKELERIRKEKEQKKDKIDDIDDDID